MNKPTTFKELLTSTFGLESLDGIECTELEFTMYARLTDLSVLDKAISKQKHEQWNIPLNGKRVTRARLRLIDDRCYTMATKVAVKGRPGVREVNAVIPKDLFIQLRAECKQGYYKTRYVFPVEGTKLNWEVDVFMGSDGLPSTWVKIDLEVDDLDSPIPELPFDKSFFTETIWADDPNITDTDASQIAQLWDVVWQEIDRIAVASA